MPCVHLNNLWTDRQHMCITVSRHGTCFWDGWPCATKCEKNGKMYVERIPGSDQGFVRTRIWSFLRWPFFASLAVALSYSSISPQTSQSSGYILALCLCFHFHVISVLASCFFLALFTVYFWCCNNETTSPTTALGTINLRMCTQLFVNRIF